MRKIWLILAIISTVSVPVVCFAMTSTNYQINWDSVNFGGKDVSTSTNYGLRDTLGEHGTGVSGSENYTLKAGYRYGESLYPYISMHIGTQENNVRSAWSTFTSSTKTVTVSDPASFIVGDYIAVIENIGFGQLIAVGKIASISGSDLIVDSWSGEPASISISASGGNDFVYRMNGDQAALGIQTLTSESVSVTMTDIVSNANNGYTVSIQGVDKLRAGTAIIRDITDGTVTLGQEEYGVESVGQLSVGSGQDVDIPTSTTRTIQQSATYGEKERIAIIYKLAITASTPTGNYQQTVIYRVTGNF